MVEIVRTHLSADRIRVRKCSNVLIICREVCRFDCSRAVVRNGQGANLIIGRQSVHVYLTKTKINVNCYRTTLYYSQL